VLILLSLASSEAEPVSLAEAKAHLRVIHSSDDAMIDRLIVSAREAAEQFTNRALVAATYRWIREGFESRFVLPLWPVATVDAVSYLDDDDTRQTVSESDYTFDADRLSLRPLDSWPSGTEVNVEFTTDPGEVPQAIKQAILLMVGDMYEQGNATIVGTIVARNPAVDYLLWPYRRGLGA